MKVALVHDFLTSVTGAERVLKVLSEMYPEAPIFTLLYDEDKVRHVFPKTKVRPSGLQRFPKLIRGRRRFLLSKMPVEVEQFNLNEYELVISSSGAFSKGVITKPETLHICYCHAPMRYAWDWHAEYAEEHHLKSLKGFLAQSLLSKVRLWDKVSSDRPDAYIANSKITQTRLKKYYQADSTVIYPPVELGHATVQTKHDNYFLIVSRLEPYKRIDLAVQVMSTMKDHKLVIIGEGSDEMRLKNMAGSNIDFLGFQPDAVIQKYYANCRGFFFPGEDDFGITPVEAMAYGKPVLAYGKGGALETIIPGKTGIFFGEPTASSFKDGLDKLMILEHTLNPHDIRTQAEQFSRERFVEGMTKFISAHR